MPELVFLRRGEEVLRFTLDRPRVVLGRGDRCDVVIPDPEVSRQQAAVILSGDSAVVEDLSGKGTVVGGTRAPRGLAQRRGGDRARAVASHLPRSCAGRRRGGRDRGPGNRGASRGEAGSDRWQAAQIRLRHSGTESVHRLVGEGVTIGKDPGTTWCSRTGSSPASTCASPAGAGRFQVLDHASPPTAPCSARCGSSRRRCRCTPSSASGETEVALEPASSGAARTLPAAFQGIIGSRSGDAAADRAHRAGRALVRRGGHPRRVRHRQGAGRARPPRPPARARAALHPGQLRGDPQGADRERALRPREGRLHRRDRTRARAPSRRPTAARCSSTRSASCRSTCRPSCCARSSPGRSSASAPAGRCHVDVRVVAATNRDLLGGAPQRASSARTSTTGSASSRCTCRRCATAAGTSRLLAEHFLAQFFARAGRRCGSRRRRIDRLAGATAGRATCASCATWCTARCSCARGPMIDAADLTFDPGAVDRGHGRRASPELPAGHDAGADAGASWSGRSSRPRCASSTTTASAWRRSWASPAPPSSSGSRTGA